MLSSVLKPETSGCFVGFLKRESAASEGMCPMKVHVSTTVAEGVSLLCEIAPLSAIHNTGWGHI